jgi:1,4-alpha-glucan branching enzyme
MRRLTRETHDLPPQDLASDGSFTSRPLREKRKIPVMKPIGYLSIVLHAHLPFVRHPEYPDFLEEDWLYEAMTETYIPLLQMMERLQHDRVPFALTMSMTPPLCEMLADKLLQDRYIARLERLIELAARQAHKHKGTPFQDAARHAHKELLEVHHDYTTRWKRNLLGAFARLQDESGLAIVTCAATHGFLPLMATDEARRAQIEIGCNNYKRHFGRAPRGIWLPECAYLPGMELLLDDAGIQYTFLESHGLLDGRPKPRLGTARPVCTPIGVMAFGRDQECSHQVWSAEEGYPGDPLYREFYRDLGYDLSEEELGASRHPDGIRRNLGIKYHRITGKVDLSKKEPYVPTWARERAALHAGDFLRNRRRQCAYLRQQNGVTPHLTAPYDAELFGHWWFEGPLWLEFLFRKAAFDQNELVLITPEDYLEREQKHQMLQPSLSSWGANGYYGVWLNHTNEWIYPHLHHAEERMVEATRRITQPTPLQKRILAQMARELVLAQSSDWAFIMTMQTTVPYAEKRTREHIHRFHLLYEQLPLPQDLALLEDIESKDNLFPEIDYKLYHPNGVKHHGAGSAVWTASI